jgi:hypothetical protein
MTYACILPGQKVLSPELCFSTLTIPVQALSPWQACKHNCTTYLVCSHGAYLLQPHLPPLGTIMVRGPECLQPKNLVSCIQVFNPEASINVL